MPGTEAFSIGGGETVLFWVVAALSVLGACGLLFARKAVHAAMSMALVMVSLGMAYIGQGAEFLGIIQIFVYSGAVMMLFLFVVMLVGVNARESMVETLRGQRWAGLLFAAGLGLLLCAFVGRATMPRPAGLEGAAPDGTVTAMAYEIFGGQVWVFEALGSLLVIATLGAMVLAHHERLGPKATQADWSRRRIAQNRNVAGLPAPGVYARHNAVDTPALLPDGTPSELSVSRVLVARDQVRRPGEVDLESGAGAAAAGVPATARSHPAPTREGGADLVSADVRGGVAGEPAPTELPAGAEGAATRPESIR